MARIMSASQPLPGTVQRAAKQLAMKSPLSSSKGLSMTFMPPLSIVAAKVDKLGLSIMSFKEPLGRAIREVMIPSIRTNFEVEGRPKWEPLAEATAAFYNSIGLMPDNPLIRTGKLMKVSTQVNIWTVDRNSAEIKDLPASIWYGKIHQFGASPKSKSFAPAVKAGVASVGRTLKYYEAGYTAQQASRASALKIAEGDGDRSIPARPFLMIQPEDKEAIERIFYEWLNMRIAAVKWSI